MTHTAILPVVLPLVTAAVLVLLADASLRTQRIVSTGAMLAALVVSVLLALGAADGGRIVYRVGGWPSPFGVLLVVDRLSAAMLVLADVVSLAAVVQALGGGDARGRHFHVLLHLQVAGIHGAFLTGDFFNLFVFFEVLLIASYGLLVHGMGARRIRAAVHYVVVNLVGSALFLVGLGVLYGSTGALNMAHVAARIPELSASDLSLVRAAFGLFAVVFALKAGLVPLHFWLTPAYSSARPEVAASFAIMTKVGVYCIVRAVTLVPEATREVVFWLLPLSLVTQVVASLGALASRELGRMHGYLLVSSIGVMLTGVAIGEPHALAAGLFYLAHSTVSVAAAFLVAACIARARGPAKDHIRPALMGAPRVALGACFAFVAMAVVGLPPLPGFIGKAALLASASRSASGAAAFAVILLSSLLGLVACARAASTIFWEVPASVPAEVPAEAAPREATRRVCLRVPLGLFAALVALTLFAGAAMDHATRTEAQLRDRDGYVRAVLGAR